MFIFIVFILHHCISASFREVCKIQNILDDFTDNVQEYEVVEIMEKPVEPKQRSATGRVFIGNDCEYLRLNSITWFDRCTNGIYKNLWRMLLSMWLILGDKFVIKQVKGVRKQFLILNGQAILGFVKKGKKFTECSSYTEVTPNVDCKVKCSVDFWGNIYIIFLFRLCQTLLM